MDEVENEVMQRAVRYEVFAPTAYAVDSFEWQGARIVPRSRIEAKDRGLDWYTSEKIHPLDKLFVTVDGQAVVVRSTNRGLTRGQIKVADRLHRARRAKGLR